MTKKTKREKFVEIEAILTEAGNTELAEAIAHEIEMLDKKAATAKAKAAEKKVTGDALADAVFAVLTDEPQTIADIAANVDFPDSSVAKVQYRLRVLAENGKAVKSEVTVSGGEGTKARKLVAYAVASVDAE